LPQPLVKLAHAAHRAGVDAGDGEVQMGQGGKVGKLLTP
jgi:hypothetical protein